MSLFNAIAQLKIELRYLLGKADVEIVVPSPSHVDVIAFALKRELGVEKNSPEELFIRDVSGTFRSVKVFEVTVRAKKK